MLTELSVGVVQSPQTGVGQPKENALSSAYAGLLNLTEADMKRRVNLNRVSEKRLKGKEELAAAFRDYLMETVGYSEKDAEFIAYGEFSEPYDVPYVRQEYEGKYVIGEHEYEVRYCETDFCACGLWHLSELPKFKFYMLFDLDTLPDHTGNSYLNARRRYIV